ncbi:MAG TPA: cupin domain-containing protein [Stellaceae bacterium]|nr:cupin domain-containing protein [Stellaceae bacterium]
MALTPWSTQEIATAPVVSAPDGSTVRVLCATGRGSMISFTLPPGAVSRPVEHRTVEEIWFVVAGRGRLWRKRDIGEEEVALAPGVSLTVPVDTSFQFRNDGGGPLQIVAVTMPPWPGDGEAIAAKGAWPATL